MSTFFLVLRAAFYITSAEGQGGEKKPSRIYPKYSKPNFCLFFTFILLFYSSSQHFGLWPLSNYGKFTLNGYLCNAKCDFFFIKIIWRPIKKEIEKTFVKMLLVVGHLFYLKKKCASSSRKVIQIVWTVPR